MATHCIAPAYVHLACMPDPAVSPYVHNIIVIYINSNAHLKDPQAKSHFLN